MQDRPGVFQYSSERQGSIYGILAAIFAVALVLCVGRLWFERDDALSRTAAGFTLALLLVGSAVVWNGRRSANEGTVLRQQTELHSRIFETSLDLIVVTERTGVLSQISPSCKSVLGYEPHELIGQSGTKIVHPDDLEATREEMRLARRGRQTRNFETRYVHKDRHAVTLVWTGVWSESEQLHFFIGRDMTAERQLQRAERETKEMLTAIIDASPVAIVCLAADRTVLLWSRAAQQIFGYTAEETVGRPYSLVPPGQESKAEYDALMERALAGETLRDIRVTRRRKDGVLVDISFDAAAIREAGQVKAIAYALVDITERNKLESQLRQSQKLDAIGQLTGGVAHDFNNVLSVVTGTIDLLADGVADRPDLAAIAKLIGEAADRGAELTGRLLAFARRQPLQPRITDIRVAAEEAANLLRPTLGEQIEIEWRLQHDAWRALVDPTQLVTAILNLAVNARDVMPEGGKLTIETGNAMLDEAYASAHSEVRPGAYVMLAVSDTGPGIPAALHDKVFEPFFTTKEVGKGTGLGLSMVYGFVKQSGGHIKLYSEEGHGTTFKIYLPRAGDVAGVAEPEQVQSVEGGHETLLVVEDDPAVRSSVTVQLDSLGYKTIMAHNAEQALRLIDSGAEFDLLFTDVIMSGAMNGRRLAEEAVKRRRPLRVLFTSGYTENAIVHHGRLDPDVLLLAKPYRKADLARMIRLALARPGMQ
jgi:PAS domain S-box-containing protein